jgi:HK97 family phage prohead protease
VPPDFERRSLERPVQLRAAPDGASGPGILFGYGAVFNSESRDLGGFVEEIDPLAFGPVGPLDLTVHGRILARLNHSNDLLLGTSDAGTLRLFIDDVGLGYEIDLPDTSYARDLAVLAKRGDIRHSSFAFRTPPGGDTWQYAADDRIVRRVLNASLVDVAPVADPAYWDATSALSRTFDLDAITASLKPAPTGTAPLGQRAAVSSRAKEIQHTIEGSRL